MVDTRVMGDGGKSNVPKLLNGYIMTVLGDEMEAPNFIMEEPLVLKFEFWGYQRSIEN